MEVHMKTCFKCCIKKPLSEFYAHKQMADGHLNKCKSCTKKDSFDRRYGKNREQVLQYDRERAKTEKRKKLSKKNVKQNRVLFPERDSARQKLRRAVANGLVRKLPCFTCGNNAEAHHPDYSRPLDVVWLCPEHHRQAHAIVHYLEDK
jgi:hypothetical protein